LSQTEFIEVDVRCPVGPQALLMRLQVPGSGTEGRVIETDTLPLLELACRDCARLMRRNGHTDVTRVLHRFDMFGSIIESIVET
jgi:hypothetical protein